MIEKYFDTSEKKAKLYLLLTIGQIWATIAIIIGFIVFVYFLLDNLGILGVMI
ncbi:MAG: hypothetical protein V5A76_04235 [Candidatus Thermoplasmatota archaeon]